MSEKSLPYRVTHAWGTPMPDDDPKCSYAEALRTYPQLRGLSQLYYKKAWTNEEQRELEELASIVRLNSHDCFIYWKRLKRLIIKYDIKKLTVPVVEVRNKAFSRQVSTAVSRIYETSHTAKSHDTHSVYFQKPKRKG